MKFMKTMVETAGYMEDAMAVYLLNESEEVTCRVTLVANVFWPLGILESFGGEIRERN